MPVVDRVPLMVVRESKVTWRTPAADGAVIVRLLNVFIERTSVPDAEVDINVTL